MLRSKKHKIALGAFVSTIAASTGVTIFFLTAERGEGQKPINLIKDLNKFKALTTIKTDAELRLLLPTLINPTKDELGYNEPELTEGVEAIYSVPEIYNGGVLKLHVHLTLPGYNVVNNDKDFILTPPIESTRNKLELNGMIANMANVPLTGALLGIEIPSDFSTSGADVITGSYDEPSNTYKMMVNGKALVVAPRRNSSLAPWTVGISDSFVSTFFQDELVASIGSKTTVIASDLGFIEPYPWPNDHVSAVYQIEPYSGKGNIKVNFILRKEGITEPLNNKGSFTIAPRLPISLYPWRDETKPTEHSTKRADVLRRALAGKTHPTARDLGFVEPTDWAEDLVTATYTIAPYSGGNLHVEYSLAIQGFKHVRKNTGSFTLVPHS